MCFDVRDLGRFRSEVVEQPACGGHGLEHPPIAGRFARRRLDARIRYQEFRQPFDPWIVGLGVRQFRIVADRAAVPANQHKLVGDEVLSEPAQLGRLAKVFRQPILHLVRIAFDGLLRPELRAAPQRRMPSESAARTAEKRLRVGHCAFTRGSYDVWLRANTCCGSSDRHSAGLSPATARYRSGRSSESSRRANERPAYGNDPL